jgi:hypothetical protein
MRIRAFITPSLPGGYTIQADMMSTTRKTAVKEFWPDMASSTRATS